jgi:hypothetical protein
MMKSILLTIVVVLTQVSCIAKNEETKAISFTLNTGERMTHFFVASKDSDVRNSLRSDTVFKRWVESYKTYLVSKPALEHFVQYINKHRGVAGKPMLPNYTIRLFDANSRTTIFSIDGEKKIGDYINGMKHWMEVSPYKREYKDILSDIEGVIRVYGNK